MNPKASLRRFLAVLAAMLLTALACSLLEGSPANTPAPTLPAQMWAPAPPAGNAITAESAAQVHVLARWGQGRPNDLAWSPDGRLLVVAASVGLAVIETGSYTQTNFIETEAAANSLAFSPDGNRVAVGLANGSLQIWEGGAAKLAQTIPAHRRAVTSVAFSPDGATLASAGEDQTVRLWQTDTGQSVRTLDPHRGYGLALAFSPDGSRLAVSSREVGGHGEIHAGGVKVWDAAGGQLLRSISEDSLAVEAVAFSPDGRKLYGLNAVPGPDEQVVLVWDAESGALLAQFGSRDPLAAIDLSLDGKLLAVTGRDGQIRLLDAATGSETLAWNAHPGGGLKLAFSPDGARLASVGQDGKLRIWQPADGSPLAEVDGFITDTPVYGLAFSPDSAWLASAWGGRAAIRLGEVASGKEIYAIPGDSGETNAVAFSPDGARLASAAHQDGVARLWDSRTGRLLQTFTHGEPVTDVAFSPDGARLASASWDRTVRVWDATTGKEILSLQHDRAVKSVAFSPDGARLATGSEDGFARTWDAATGAQLAAFDLGDWVESVAFSPDGSRLAAAADNRVFIFMLASGENTLVLNHPPGSTVQSIAFSPDGSLIAAGSYDDPQVYLWDSAGGQTAAVLSGHTDSVWSLAFAPNGLLLATGSADGSIRLWGIAP